MSSFADQQIASKTRDVIERIARGVLRRERPEPRIGKVFDYNSITQKARVLFAGDTIEDLVSVGFSKNNTPVTYMNLTYSVDGLNAPGDVVRVWGKPGNYFILDYIWGGPESSSSAITGVTALHNNPSFDTVSGGVPTAWNFFWGPGIPTATTSDVFSGTYSLTIDTTTAAGGSKVCMSSIFSVQPGDSVTISIWAKSVSGQADLDFALLSRTTGTPDLFDGANTVFQGPGAVTLTTVWTKYTGTYTVPPGHTVARIQARINQTVSGNQAVARLDLSTSSKTPASNAFMPAGSWPKEACNAATTANVASFAGGAPLVVDGVTLAAGNRVLVRNQTTPAQNGIYLVQLAGTGSDGTWARASDAATAAAIAGCETVILGGTVYGGFAFKCKFKVTDTLGTTVLNWYPSHDTDWINMQLIGAWLGFDSGLSIGGTGRVPQIRRINGVVYYKGVIKSGVAGTAFYNVPVGFRVTPTTVFEGAWMVQAQGNGLFAHITYDATNHQLGATTGTGTPNSFAYLSPVIYPAEL